MIEETQTNTKHHMCHTKHNGQLHFEWIGESQFVGSYLPDLKINKGNQIKKLNKQINKWILNLQFTQSTCSGLCILKYSQSYIGWSSMGNDKMTA